MSLKDILVFLDAATPSEERLRLATRIAQDHQACLSAAFLQNDKAPGAPHEVAAPWLGLVASPPIAGSVHTTQSATLAERAEQGFRDRLGSRQLQGDWHVLDRPETSVLITLAQAADLIIIGQIDPNIRPAPTWRPEDVVIGCGRPMLMVPYVGSFDRVGRRVLIAWDGSRELCGPSTMHCH